jgi:hypothetical protein
MNLPTDFGLASMRWANSILLNEPCIISLNISTVCSTVIGSPSALQKLFYCIERIGSGT